MSEPDDFDRYVRPNPAKRNDMVSIKVEKTFSFNQDNVLDLIVDYLKREQGVSVTKDKLRVNISDSTTGGMMDRDFIPARINSISVVVPDNNRGHATRVGSPSDVK